MGDIISQIKGLVCLPCKIFGDICPCCCCFPPNAGALLSNGQIVKLEDLRIGDEVIVMDEHGVFKTSRVYAFGHRDYNYSEKFHTIIASSNDSSFVCTMTRDHRIPALKFGAAAIAYIRVCDLSIGDAVYVAETWHVDNRQLVGDLATKATVAKITEQDLKGIFAPLTEEGTILVDGVIASCYAVGASSHAFCHQAITPFRALLQCYMALALVSQQLATTVRASHATSLLYLGQLPSFQVPRISNALHPIEDFFYTSQVELHCQGAAKEAVTKPTAHSWDTFFPAAELRVS